MRKARYYDEETNRDFVFLTNNLNVPALTVPEIYRLRWRIETVQIRFCNFLPEPGLTHSKPARTNQIMPAFPRVFQCLLVEKSPHMSAHWNFRVHLWRLLALLECVAATGTAVAAYQENFHLRQGLFITWTGMPDGVENVIRFSDGSRAKSMDEFARAADPVAVADQAARYGFDHVVLMDFHGAGTTLHPCAALDAWRGPGFTSKRDLIGEMIAAFKAKGIRVFLFTHPLDGHDYSQEQQKRLGFNDPTDGYRRWNDFVNDVHAEIVERYGKDIVGIGMDSEFGLSSDKRWAGKLDLPRLRATILSRCPGLSLAALAGPNDTCELGVKEVWRPSWLDPWMSRNETDYNSEKWPAYRRSTAVVQGFHWATIEPPEKGKARLNGVQMFRYSVLQAGAGTEGSGVQWAASPYPNGSWEKGVAEAFAELNALVTPVRESLRDVYPSTSYPTPEGTFLSTLPHGIVATKSIDSTVEYLHVLNPPRGKTLKLPAPADGRKFRRAMRLADGHQVDLMQSTSELSLTLSGKDSWIPHDTVIKLIVENPPRSNLALHGFVTSSSSLENTGLGGQTPWGRIRLVDGLSQSVPAPQEWSVGINGWSSSPSPTSREEWVQVDLGRTQRIGTVRLHPRNDPGQVGQGFPVNFKILASSDGKRWSRLASVVRQALPKSAQTWTFPAEDARYIRVVGKLLRSNPKDANRFSMQFAELEVFGPD